MSTLTQEQIKEIAEQLDCGFRCFWNKTNGDLLFVPDTLKYPDMEMDSWSDEMKKLNDNFDEYKEIDSLGSHDSFEIMGDFIQTLSDSNKLKGKLIVALNRRKPFAGFKFLIDNSGDYRQKWFEFKTMKVQEWVVKKANEIINLQK